MLVSHRHSSTVNGGVYKVKFDTVHEELAAAAEHGVSAALFLISHNFM